jgi:predicted Zn-dependent protease
MSMIENFEKMLAAGKDSALLRFSLGNAYLQSEDQDSHLRAITHLREAVKHDSDYSAAWKLLGKAYIAVGDVTNAADAYREGIRAAEAKGDKQAAKEMAVFLKRLQK